MNELCPINRHDIGWRMRLQAKVLQRAKSRELAIAVAELAAAEASTLGTDESIAFWDELKNRFHRMISNTQCYRCGGWPCTCSDGITLLHGNCLTVLPQINSVDAIITDPPYGQSYISRRRLDGPTDAIAGDHSLSTFYAAWPLMYACLRDGSHWYVFGSSKPELVSQQNLLSEAKQILVWDKQNGTAGDLACSYANSTELIYFGCRGRRELNGRPRSVFRYIKPITNLHPTAKPVGLIAELMRASTKKNEIVLDPFSGTGSTLITAKKHGRRAIGIEIDERYCEVAADQLRQHTLPLRVE